MKSFRKNWKEWLGAYIFIAPAMIGLFLFMVYPLIKGMYLSFYDVKLMDQTFIGLDNYAKLFNDKHFIQALGNTAQYTLGIIALGVPLSLIMAVFMNQKMTGITGFRLFYYLPVITSMIAVSMVWKGLFTADGLINQIIGLIGIDPVNWLTDERYALMAVIIMSIWKGSGFNMLVFLGGLQTIPTSIYEAADVDGASPITKFFKITLPLLSPTIFFVSVTTIINSFQVFEQAQILTDGGPKGATSTIVLTIYENAFEAFQPGYASAQAVVLFLILLSITILQFIVQKRWVYKIDE
ncbi:hypothetical protein AN640_01260 [Candidatus Epulonipiscium fishelsonii]|uniref:Uncharacterized protein n=1 Tax=Candidatus Epulonipiscium fishelsonii TaxID=77094 RepID=A0ACC8XFZ3_9FIRM|nr:hypothetical protein AN640_01260 [Epulopiscium sp. SCG-D08WGA-EpuloA1]OON93812.1 MAG: hypothetical protein ATN32_08645 [Epulopiscium sp. AS2M-Bin002]